MMSTWITTEVNPFHSKNSLIIQCHPSPSAPPPPFLPPLLFHSPSCHLLSICLCYYFSPKGSQTESQRWASGPIRVHHLARTRTWLVSPPHIPHWAPFAHSFYYPLCTMHPSPPGYTVCSTHIAHLCTAECTLPLIPLYPTLSFLAHPPRQAASACLLFDSHAPSPHFLSSPLSPPALSRQDERQLVPLAKLRQHVNFIAQSPLDDQQLSFGRWTDDNVLSEVVNGGSGGGGVAKGEKGRRKSVGGIDKVSSPRASEDCRLLVHLQVRVGSFVKWSE